MLQPNFQLVIIEGLLKFIMIGENKPKLAYVEEITKHRQQLPLYDLKPRTDANWIAPNATLGIYCKTFY